MPGLDGMRALAVVAVMVYHANSTWLPGGFLGVEVFFVISGYLITVLLIGTLLIASAPAAERAVAVGAPGTFFDGGISYSTITNCTSIIFPPTYTEFGAGVYVGAYADPDEQPPVPGVNQPFYVHIVVYGLGNACSGQRFLPALSLPAGVSFAQEFPIL